MYTFIYIYICVCFKIEKNELTSLEFLFLPNWRAGFPSINPARPGPSLPTFGEFLKAFAFPLEKMVFQDTIEDFRTIIGPANLCI